MNPDALLAQLISLGFIALAMLLGAVIGCERELAAKPAGMRTHMLVAGAAALLISLAGAIITESDAKVASGVIRSDPIRTVEAIITGVSFLGAGTIIRNGRRGGVEGLTTAASLLFTTGVGIAVALRELPLAIGATLLVLITLRTVHLVERRLPSKQSSEGKSGDQQS